MSTGCLTPGWRVVALTGALGDFAVVFGHEQVVASAVLLGRWHSERMVCFRIKAPANLPDRLGVKEAARQDGLLPHIDGTCSQPMPGEEFVPALNHVEHALDQGLGLVGAA